jgi:hypothetical protein
MNDLNQENKLDIETFEKLASCIPKLKRNNFNQITNTLLSLFKKSTNNF